MLLQSAKVIATGIAVSLCRVSYFSTKVFNFDTFKTLHAAALVFIATNAPPVRNPDYCETHVGAYHYSDLRDKKEYVLLELYTLVDFLLRAKEVLDEREFVLYNNMVNCCSKFTIRKITFKFNEMRIASMLLHIEDSSVYSLCDGPKYTFIIDKLDFIASKLVNLDVDSNYGVGRYILENDITHEYLYASIEEISLLIPSVVSLTVH